MFQQGLAELIICFIFGVLLGWLIPTLIKRKKKPLTPNLLMSYYTEEEVNEVLNSMLDKRLEEEEDKKLAEEANTLQDGFN